ncbi:FAD-dependent oxidoreductase [Cyanobium sp. WAJ14-Wanaka]|uniref:FAD-dependent oxidoreductase n=1 Tax=Cyanobium sp. WAJ14-Wanaka TaxID=2823725 RepID=UPI0020CD4672|nr:FAD-dependent oxidoreductase [Cyanobium sp. WAJ14-Wanaka]MCP9774556.1 FAD-dependent oxidoreductase [Cyanobium sp. WAJ14-Wanaka]
MAPSNSNQESAQVVVWGGGTGGVAAALQAARGGARTLLLTPGPWLGGMVSAAGVCAPDGNELTPWQTGLWGAFLRALAHNEPEGLDQNWVSCFGYRPATAEAILRRWCGAEALLQWWPQVELRSVRSQGNRIRAVEIVRDGLGIDIALDVLIDGSDQGDVWPLAQAPYRLGWEAKELWDEPSAPSAQALATDPFFKEQPVQSPTWVVMGQLAKEEPSSGLNPKPQLPAPFDSASENFGLERTITYGRLPGGLVMLNWPLAGNDWHHQLGDLFESDPAQRAEIYGQMRAHSLAFADALKEASAGWLQLANCFPADGQGPAAEALQGPSALALMPYWREGRRLVGQTCVLEQHLLPPRAGCFIAPMPLGADGTVTSIAVGNYANDHHYPGGDFPLAPKSCRWGGRWSGTPFTIPYGALLSSEFDNLMAADKCFSSSHMANGATRLQPLILNIGQASGAAAALAVAKGIPPAQLPVRELQEILINDPTAPAAVVPLWDTPWHHPQWRERQRQVLEAPELLGEDGRLQTSYFPVPSEPGESAWQGVITADGSGGFVFDCDASGGEGGAGGKARYPLITLEPELHDWLNGLDRPTSANLVGCLNPYGPWLRASRLGT